MKQIFDTEVAKNNLIKTQKHNKLYWILFGVFLALTIAAAIAVFRFKSHTVYIVSMCACLVLAFIAYTCHSMITRPTVELAYYALLNNPNLNILKVHLQKPLENDGSDHLQNVWVLTENSEGDIEQHLLGAVKEVRNTRVTEQTLNLNKGILYFPFKMPEE